MDTRGDHTKREMMFHSLVDIIARREDIDKKQIHLLDKVAKARG